jgi:glycosyltransferase involved in cell wall biosynthesis
MRVAIDGFNLALPKGTGVATYGFGLARALQSMGHTVDGVFGLNAGTSPETRELLFFDAFGREQPFGKREKRRYIRRPMLRTLFPLSLSEVPLTDKVEKRDFQYRFPDFSHVYTYPYLFELALARFRLTRSFLTIKLPRAPEVMHWTYPVPLRVHGARNIYTVHDLVPLRMPHTTLDDKKTYHDLVKQCVLNGHHVCTVSEASRQDILTQFPVAPEKVTNTYQAALIPAEIAGSSIDEDARIVSELFHLEPRGYFLFFGAIDPKKNVDRILEAYLKSGNSLPLVMVLGRDWGLGYRRRRKSSPSDIFERYGDQKIIQLEYLPRPMLFRLIKMARAVVFPSLYEGFGLPALEAIQLGTPVLTSNLSSLPEVVGDAGLQVDPYSVEDIARGFITLENNDALYQSLLAAGPGQISKFSYRTYVERLTKMYAQII